MKWIPLNPDKFDPRIFGLGVSRIHKLQCTRGYGAESKKIYRQNWFTCAQYLTHHPVTDKSLTHNQWWIFAIKHTLPITRKEHTIDMNMPLLNQFASYICRHLSIDTKSQMLQDFRKNPKLLRNIDGYYFGHLHDLDDIIDFLVNSVFYDFGYRLVALGLLHNHNDILEEKFEVYTETVYDCGESDTKSGEDEYRSDTYLNRPTIEWHRLNPDDFDPKSFEVSKIDRIQCRRLYAPCDLGIFNRKGWSNFVRYLNHHPATKKPLSSHQYWIFAVKHSVPEKDNNMIKKLSLLEQFARYITSNLSDDTRYRLLMDLRKNPTLKENIDNYNANYLYDINEKIQVLTQNVFYILGYQLIGLGLINNTDYILEDVFEADTDLIYDFGESYTKAMKGETDGVHTGIN